MTDLGIDLDPRFEILQRDFPGLVRQEGFRTYLDPTTRLNELVAIDANSAKHEGKLTPEIFFKNYMLLYEPGLPTVGVYKAFRQAWPEDFQFLHSIDLLYDQFKRKYPEEFDTYRNVRREESVVDEIVDEIEDSVDEYLISLRKTEITSKMSDIYDDIDGHYRAFDQRIGEMVSIIQGVPDGVVIHAPGDGIGVVSLACYILQRDCVTSEPSGVGARAVKLGLIKHAWTAQEHLIRHPKAFYIFSHLSRFVHIDYENYVGIVYDQACSSIRGYRALHWTGVLQTNSPDVEEKAYVVAYVRCPNIQFQNKRLSATDDYMIAELKHQQVYDADAPLVAVRDKTCVKTGEEYVLMERRVASAITSRMGATVIKDGVANFINSDKVRIYCDDFMQTMTGHESTTVLDSRYDMSGYQYVRVILPFYPNRVRYAYSNKAVVPVSLLLVNEILGSTGGYPKLLYDVVLRAHVSWIDASLTYNQQSFTEILAQEMVYRHAKESAINFHKLDVKKKHVLTRQAKKGQRDKARVQLAKTVVQHGDKEDEPAIKSQVPPVPQNSTSSTRPSRKPKPKPKPKNVK